MAEPLDLDFDVRVRTVGDAKVISLEGDLDIVTAPEAAEALARAQAAGGTVVLDLRGLRFIDSSGVRVVLESKRRADAAGGRLQVAPGGAGVRRVFDLSGVSALIEIVDSPPGDAA